MSLLRCDIQGRSYERAVGNENAYPYLFKFYLSVIKGKFEVDTYLDCVDLSDFDCEYKEEYMQFTYYQ